MADKPKFSIGQLVMCSMYEGLWAIHDIERFQSKKNGEFVYHRYEIRQGETYKTDIVEVWLSGARLRMPEFRVVGGNDKPKRTFRVGDHGGPTGGNAA